MTLHSSTSRATCLEPLTTLQQLACRSESVCIELTNSSAKLRKERTFAGFAVWTKVLKAFEEDGGFQLQGEKDLEGLKLRTQLQIK